MDGFKKRLRESLQFRLSVSLAGISLLLALAAGVVSFLSAFEEVNELQDDVLRQVAALLEQQRVLPRETMAMHPASKVDESRVLIQFVTPTGQQTGRLPLSPLLPDGLHSLILNGQPFRVLIQTFSSGIRVAVAQESALRDEIARDIALRTATPQLLLIPIMLWLLSRLVGRMLRPITALSHELDLRQEMALHPVEAGRLPLEIRPFAIAINRLLDRIGQAVESQRRFVADAAHELRSPMAALALQAERLAEIELPPPARERLTTLHCGIERSRRLLNQLLAMARAQSLPVANEACGQISVQAVFRRTLEDLLPLAEAKAIDIGVVGEQEIWVTANELDLLMIVKNLVDNAIRYTPAGGKVDLSVCDLPNGICLNVSDSGPGIPEDDRSRVFDPFYRVLGTDQQGSGLGLSIVRVLAVKLGAIVQLDWTDTLAKRGLSVSVILP
ncbi:two-component sensor histidine kinase [Chromobacterium sphagni]|uniref:histidine kinase n=2 Tax=Chromobacterium sphagni TaxID=1903179 RepID=A0ABX3CAF1_9NEIS|nr:two-component sensor histidine kinase [Chromobacterium sphagni]